MTDVTVPVSGDMVDGKAWYESKGVIGALVTSAALIASFAGFNVDGALQAEVTEATLEAVAMAGAIYSLIGRLVATKEVK